VARTPNLHEIIAETGKLTELGGLEDKLVGAGFVK